jgi:hypothetical protein
MTPLKRIATLYLSCIIFYVLISKLFGGQLFDILRFRGLWLIPLFVILIGHSIGYLSVLTLENKPKKQVAFNISYLVIFLCFAVITFYYKYSFWRHQKNFGNIEANKREIKYFAIEEKVAFDSLSKLLVDPNSFELTGGSVSGIDTVLDGHKQTILFSTLQYRKGNQKTVFKSRFAIINSTAHLIYYDVPLDREDKRIIDSSWNAVIENYKKAMKAMPDSIKKRIDKEFKEVADN